jgi:acetylornithine deacetylase/succinyl-diaminopimelate desuccinylase-like protein
MTIKVNPAIRKAVEHARANHGEYLEGFLELLRIPSISTDPAYKHEIQRAADWLVSEMDRIGLENCEAIPSERHPVVYGEWLGAGEDKPTVLVYAHYDVQPVDPLEAWESPPFEPSIREGNLYARGAIDDKCGVFVNLKAIESMLATSGELPVNVKIFFEGDEEGGSTGMQDLIARHTDKLTADFLLLSDGGSLPDNPMVITSVRGIVDGEVIVTGPKIDLHSGSFGGIVHNPAHLVGRMIAALHDQDGRVQIPGFYDNVRPLDAIEHEQMRANEPIRRAYFEEQSGLTEFWGVQEYSLIERATAQPTCDVNGVYGGYQGDGGKTIIPSRAGFKVSMRLVSDQDPEDILQKFTQFIDTFACDTLNIEVTTSSSLCYPAHLLAHGPEIEAIQQAFEAVWGKRASLYRQGGSVPITGMFQKEMGIPIAGLGFATGYNGHAPNEYYILEYFYRSIDTAIHFYNFLAESGKAER